MSRPFEVPVAPATAEGFAPFGTLIGAPGLTPDYKAEHLAGWRVRYESEGETIFLVMHYEHSPFECHALERHFAVTQCFLPLSDSATIMVVAAPTKGGALPRLEDVRAFYVLASEGIMLWKGTWHALTRFPVRRSGARLAFLSEKRTQQELEDAQRGGPRPTLTEKIDLSELYGSHISIVDPAGLMRTS